MYKSKNEKISKINEINKNLDRQNGKFIRRPHEQSCSRINELQDEVCNTSRQAKVKEFNKK